MSTVLADKDLKLLQEFGFSAKQAEGILTVTRQETQEVATKVESKMVTKEYLAHQFTKMKLYFIVQAVGIVLASLGLLGWYINYLDNKTHRYIEARFLAQEERFSAIDQRFDKIESDLNDIKNFIFSRAEAIEGTVKKPHNKGKQKL